jgi:DNA-binding CsgD family transcriptional regulator
VTKLDLGELAHACYALEAAEPEWLAGIIGVLRPGLDVGMGIGAWRFQLGAWSTAEPLVGDVDPEVESALKQVGADSPEERSWRFFLSSRAQSMTERLGFRDGLSHDEIYVPFQPLGIRDLNALTLIDASGHGIGFVAPAPQLVHSALARTRRLERIGAHVLSGFRLRRALGQVAAVLAPDGRLLDAVGEAQGKDEQAALRSAVKALDQAWSRRTSDVDDALEVWTGLVSGRWSLVQRFDSDGRRYLVARKNRPGEKHPLAAPLPPLAAQALLIRAHAASYKQIAYELGLSVASVHRLVKDGIQRLGLGNEGELALLFRASLSAKPPEP